MSVFWQVHSGLEREGPGSSEDVAWAADVAGLAEDARICDVACGPGADIASLLRAAPKGHVTALDKHGAFVEQAATRYAGEPRVTFTEGDMANLSGPYDFIWCAGAVYFLGVTKALSLWRGALAEGGHVAFSEPCFFTPTPSDGARGFWEGHPVSDAAGIAAQVREAGFETRATRVVSDAGWETYYISMEARIAELRQGADAEMLAALVEHEEEITGWRKHRAETGYLLSVVAPV